MANIIYIATSIDGFIAKLNGDIDWLMETANPDGSDFGFSDFMNSIDAIVMGRNTFEQVLKFGEWPYTKQVFVLSKTLKTIPQYLSTKAKIIKGKPATVIKKLNSLNYYNLYIDGGKTIKSFLKEELIDELIITRIPILLGEGIPLFSKLKTVQKYEHVETLCYNNTLVKSRYRIVKTV